MRTTRASSPKLACAPAILGLIMLRRKDANHESDWPQLPANANPVQALTVQVLRANWKGARARGRRKPNPATRWLTGRKRLIEMGRLGGLATAASRTPEERIAAARRAAAARWRLGLR